MIDNLGKIGGVILYMVKKDAMINEQVFSILNNLLKNKEYDKIIDVGCDNGRLGTFLRCKSDNIIGIDIDYNIKPKNKIYYDDFIYADLSTTPEALTIVNGNIYILCDIIKHLNKCQCRNLFKHIPDNSDVFLSTPKKLSNAHMIIKRNKFYTHQSIWTQEELSDFGFNKFHEIYDKHIVAIRS